LSTNYAVSCVSSVYDSAKAKDFSHPDTYPIAWEIIYRNDESGKALTAKVHEVMEELDDKDGMIMAMQGEHSDVARSVELSFASADAFSKAVRSILKDIRLHQEQDGKLITKHQLIQNARSVVQERTAALAV